MSHGNSPYNALDSDKPRKTSWEKIDNPNKHTRKLKCLTNSSLQDFLRYREEEIEVVATLPDGTTERRVVKYRVSI